MRIVRTLAIVASLLVPCASRTAWATDITACGTVVAAGTRGVLQADLDCSSNQFGVIVLSHGTLDLNGHTIAGGDATEAVVVGAMLSDGTRKGNFTIQGPGSLSGTGRNYNTPVGTWACVQANDGRVRIGSMTGVVDIHGCVYGLLGSATMDSNGLAHAFLDHVSLHNNVLDGAAVGSLVASDVDASNNGGQGLGAAKIAKVTNVTTMNNVHGHGVFAGTKLKGTNVTTSGNYSGAEAWTSLEMADSTATGNTFDGVAGVQVKLSGSAVTGNGVIDILSRTLPRLFNTTCGKSSGKNNTCCDPSTSWGVCNGS